MAIQVVHIDNSTYENPFWEFIEGQIRSMDGDSPSDIFLEDSDRQHFMLINGGNENRYLVVVQEQGSDFFYLLNTTVQTGQLLVKIGGVEDFYPAHLVNDLGTTISAAKTYMQSLCRDSRYEWKRSDASLCEICSKTREASLTQKMKNYMELEQAVPAELVLAQMEVIHSEETG